MVTIEKYVLGIDAAWTVKNPSGVALLKWFPNSKPELVRAGRSYDEFCNIGKPDWQNSIGDSKHNPDFVKIIECCHKKVDLVGCNFLDGKAEPKPPDDQTGVIWVPKKIERYCKPYNPKCYASLLPAPP